jgi:AcrR family transcriptional regulator
MGRKDEILIAAEDAFIKYGLDKIALDDIAHECGVKKTALYYYFKNKEEILGAMLIRKVESIMHTVRSEVMKHDNVKDRLRAFMRTKIESMRENMQIMELFDREGLPKKVMEFLWDIQRKMGDNDFSLVKEVIQQGVQNQRISYELNDSLVLMILGVTYGSFVAKHIDACNWDVDAMIETSIDVILKGIE